MSPSNNSSGRTQGGNFVDGSATLFIATSASAVGATTRTVTIEMAVGDFVEVQGFQDSGGALNTSTTSEIQPSLTAEFRGEG